ncbi:MAG TPA: amino acid deaminase/aldolase [Thermoleophilaceae bacterium]|nr:amino acid deaminase/aldolase [Thermoleophilaceae bacterium]
MSDLERYESAFAGRDAPFAFVDLGAMWANAADMLRRAGGKPIRVASKSVRCRPLLRAILDRSSGFRGLMTYTLRESLWLDEHGFGDLLLAYPTADRRAIGEIAQKRPTLMIDSTEHLDLLDGARNGDLRVCIEVDMSYRLPGARTLIGPKRSPIRTPEEAAALARAVVDRPGFELVGVMGYEGHVAGVGDEPPGQRAKGLAIRAMQRASVKEIATRRAEVVAAVEEVAPLRFVNGGGTGSIDTTAAEEAVTEVTAGSGFFAPTLFDSYSAFELTPAAMFALPVVRRPSRTVATTLGGGYLASGAGEPSRLPTPYLPPGLRLDPQEGAGEVQTPVTGRAASDLRIGDRVYFRHAKAGELCEHFDTLLLVEGDAVVDEVPTYRGEGKLFL